MEAQKQFPKADVKRLKELRAKSRRNEVIIGAQLIKLKQEKKITQQSFNEVMGISNPQEH